MPNLKITELTELTTIADSDLLAVVDDPGGTPVTKKITKANLITSLGMEIDYVTQASSVNPTATTEGTANTIITGNAVAYDGATPVMIEFCNGNSRPDLGGGTISFWLYDNGTSIGRIAYISNGGGEPVFVKVRITPSNATHTYSVRASVSTGTGLVSANTGGIGVPYPTTLRIVKANP